MNNQSMNNELINYDQLIIALPEYFKNFTRFNQENYDQIQPNVSSSNILDLSFVKEDIINIENAKFNKKVYVILPSHIVSINFKKHIILLDRSIENIKFLFFPQSLLRITLGFPLSNIPDLPNNLIYLNLENCINLTRLPNLPVTLKYLNVANNRQLSILPKLPDELMILICDRTSVTNFENLPDMLQHLQCGMGGSSVSLRLPSKWPNNLEYLRLGTYPSFPFNRLEYTNRVRANPYDYIDPNDEGIITEEMIIENINEIETEHNEEYDEYINFLITNVENPQNLREFPDNLKFIFVCGTNIQYFPLKLPKIWNNTKDYKIQTSYGRTFSKFHIQICGTEINLFDLKYLNMLEDINRIAVKNDVKMSAFIEYCTSLNDHYINMEDFLTVLQKKQHSEFNISIGSKNVLGITDKNGTKKMINNLTPQISEYLSTDTELQKNTIKNTYNRNTGGRRKKITRRRRNTRTKKRGRRKLKKSSRNLL